MEEGTRHARDVVALAAEGTSELDPLLQGTQHFASRRPPGPQAGGRTCSCGFQPQVSDGLSQKQQETNRWWVRVGCGRAERAF